MNHGGVSFQRSSITRLTELVVYAETNQPKKEGYKPGNKQRDLVTNVNIKVVPSNEPQENHQRVFNKHEDIKWHKSFDTASSIQLEVKEGVRAAARNSIP